MLPSFVSLLHFLHARKSHVNTKSERLYNLARSLQANQKRENKANNKNSMISHHSPSFGKLFFTNILHSSVPQYASTAF